MTLDDFKEFVWSRLGHSGITLECCCGREHYYTAEDSGAEWTLEDIRAYDELAKEKPDRYIPHHDSWPSSSYAFGYEIVYECPCIDSTLRKLLRILTHHDLFDFLKAEQLCLSEKLCTITTVSNQVAESIEILKGL